MKGSKGDWIRGAAMAVAVWLGASGCQTWTSGRVQEPTVPDITGGVQASLGETRLLNVGVRATGADPVADSVRRKVENALAEKAFNVDANAPDVQVVLAVSNTAFDRSENYIIFQGTAEATVTRVFDVQTLGHQTLNVRGDRKLGEGDALLSVGEKLGNATAEWVLKTATSGVVDLAAADVVVRRPWRPFSGNDMAAYARLFTDRVSALHGVKACRVVSQENPDRTIVFRVLYFRQEIPEGVLNRIANVKELGISPK